MILPVLTPGQLLSLKAILVALVTARVALTYDRRKVKKMLAKEYAAQLAKEHALRQVVPEESTAPACSEAPYCVDKLAPRYWLHDMSCPLYKHLKEN